MHFWFVLLALTTLHIGGHSSSASGAAVNGLTMSVMNMTSSDMMGGRVKRSWPPPDTYSCCNDECMCRDTSFQWCRNADCSSEITVNTTYVLCFGLTQKVPNCSVNPPNGSRPLYFGFSYSEDVVNDEFKKSDWDDPIFSRAFGLILEGKRSSGLCANLKLADNALRNANLQDLKHLTLYSLCGGNLPAGLLHNVYFELRAAGIVADTSVTALDDSFFEHQANIEGVGVVATGITSAGFIRKIGPEISHIVVINNQARVKYSDVSHLTSVTNFFQAQGPGMSVECAAKSHLLNVVADHKVTLPEPCV